MDLDIKSDREINEDKMKNSYVKRKRLIKTGIWIGVVSSTLFTFESIRKDISQYLDYKRNPEVVKYEGLLEDKKLLENQSNELFSLKYEGEKISGEAKKLIEEHKSKKKSINSLIELVDDKITEQKQIPIIQRYLDFIDVESSSFENFRYGILGLFGTIFFGGGLSKSNEDHYRSKLKG